MPHSTVFHFTLHAVPKDPTPERAGAYVSCWIDFQLRDGAELLARHYLEKDGWTPGKLEGEARWCEEEHYAGTAELQYFREAEEFGACFVYHSYPLEDDESDEPGGD